MKHLNSGQTLRKKLTGFVLEWMWGMRAKSGVKEEAKVFGLSNRMGSPFTGMGMHWGTRVGQEYQVQFCMLPVSNRHPAELSVGRRI